MNDDYFGCFISNNLLTFVGRGFNFVNSKFRIPHNDQFSFAIQRALGPRAKFEIAYAGSRGAPEPKRCPNHKCRSKKWRAEVKQPQYDYGDAQ